MNRCKCLHPRQRALELADVALDLVRDEVQDFLRHKACAAAQLGVEDREASFEVWRLDVGDEAPLESRSQPVLQCRNLFRGTVGGDDDLLVDLVQRIEGVEELFLRPVFPREELNVVDEQHVDRAVLVPELAHASSGDGADHLVGELLRRQVDDALAREAVVHLMADGVHQVRLAQAHAAVEEQRVVAVARCFGHGLGGRVGELGVVTDDERREAKTRIEL